MPVLVLLPHSEASRLAAKASEVGLFATELVHRRLSSVGIRQAEAHIAPETWPSDLLAHMLLLAELHDHTPPQMYGALAVALGHPKQDMMEVMAQGMWMVKSCAREASGHLADEIGAK